MPPWRSRGKFVRFILPLLCAIEKQNPFECNFPRVTPNYMRGGIAETTWVLRFDVFYLDIRYLLIYIRVARGFE